jgi:uncharacterized sporulation protein YeaH/YhbH (DUF444 family)
VALALAACARPEAAGGKLLAEADGKLTAEDYAGAISSYTAFVAGAPEHPQIERARATQKVLERLIAAQAAMTRTQQGTDATRRELADKQAEADRLRTDTDRLRGEVTKLRADLERLRSIDLQGARQK